MLEPAARLQTGIQLHSFASQMQPPSRKWFLGFLGVALGYIILSGIGRQITRNATRVQQLENSEWVASGKSWLDRQSCRWFGLCGTVHMLNKGGWTWKSAKDPRPPQIPKYAPFWQSGEEDPASWSEEEKRRRVIPDYVFDHAPYVHLFSGEQFRPSDIAEHLVHTSPFINFTAIKEMEHDRNLTNLGELNAIEDGSNSRYVYLQSNDNVEEHPHWLTSRHNIPSVPEPDFGEGHLYPWPETDIEKPITEPQDQTPAPGSDETDVDMSGVDLLPIGPVPSKNGRCGGNSGFTCKNSKFGECCSIAGWCGGSDLYCDTLCDPLHGVCNDPLNPPFVPHADLRKRSAVRTRKAPPLLGKSNAPAILVVVPKDDGVVDAFWFFFYSFNLGQKVLNIRFGNHVGDWEHVMIRFKHGKPEAMFFSEHNFGNSYTWHAVEKYLPNPDGSGTMLGTLGNSTIEKLAKRPVAYSAVGSHANYPTAGLHPYILPWGLLHDQTDRGPLWDPALNVKSFTYDWKNRTARASLLNPLAPTSWFDYAGHWGDKYYPLSDPRQYRFAGQYHYVNGPTGPKFKRLGRDKVCESSGECRVHDWIGNHRPKRALPPIEGDEEGGLPGGNSTDAMP